MREVRDRRTEKYGRICVGGKCYKVFKVEDLNINVILEYMEKLV